MTCLSRADRQRAIGGGRQYVPDSLKKSLLVCLLYYKLYLTQEFTRAIFDIDQNTVSRDVSKLSAIIANTADPEFESVLQRTEFLQKHRIKNFKELQAVCPDLADVITDVSETPCNRPTDKDVQKKYYSGKQKDHTIKTQITISSSKRVIAVANSYPGSFHDKRVFDYDETVKKIPHQARHFLDKGYVGVDRENPGANILIPFRKNVGRKNFLFGQSKLTSFYQSIA